MRNISKSLRFLAPTVLIGAFAFTALACGQDAGTTDSSVGSVEKPSAPEAEVGVDKSVPDLPTAPDFTLPAANQGSTEISLSSFQGDKDVVLVFYRAYW